MLTEKMHSVSATRIWCRMTPRPNLGLKFESDNASSNLDVPNYRYPRPPGPRKSLEPKTRSPSTMAKTISATGA